MIKLMGNKYTSKIALYLLIMSSCVFALVYMVLAGTDNTPDMPQITAYGEPGANNEPSICGLDAVICPGEGKASWLGYSLIDSCASRDYPKGTRLEVRLAGTEDPRIVCVVRDFGPDASILPERIIDLNYNQFKLLASPEIGIIDVEIQKL